MSGFRGAAGVDLVAEGVILGAEGVVLGAAGVVLGAAGVDLGVEGVFLDLSNKPVDTTVGTTDSLVFVGCPKVRCVPAKRKLRAGGNVLSRDRSGAHFD